MRRGEERRGEVMKVELIDYLLLRVVGGKEKYRKEAGGWRDNYKERIRSRRRKVGER